MGVKFPGGKRFAFTIFDDTDNSTVANTAPVYRLLAENKIFTTKSVWVYPPRGKYGGGCLHDPEYREWILQLKSQGFEIGLHNVGDGSFTRYEILEGIEYFRTIVGEYPNVHTNHVSNPDNLYWWEQRFEKPVNYMYATFDHLYRGGGRQPGHEPSSPHFWGDVFKQRIRFIRNLTFNEINTLSCDPKMPYRIDSKPYANYWFSSSDGQSLTEMNDLLSKENIDKLETEGGACIVYTHFASQFVDASGKLNPDFEDKIQYLASKAGWFVPVSTLLDHFLTDGGAGTDPGYWYRLLLNIKWASNRIVNKFRYGA